MTQTLTFTFNLSRQEAEQWLTRLQVQRDQVADELTGIDTRIAELQMVLKNDEGEQPRRKVPFKRGVRKNGTPRGKLPETIIAILTDANKPLTAMEVTHEVLRKEGVKQLRKKTVAKRAPSISGRLSVLYADGKVDRTTNDEGSFMYSTNLVS